MRQPKRLTQRTLRPISFTRFYFSLPAKRARCNYNNVRRLHAHCVLQDTHENARAPNRGRDRARLYQVSAALLPTYNSISHENHPTGIPDRVSFVPPHYSRSILLSNRFVLRKKKKQKFLKIHASAWPGYPLSRAISLTYLNWSN